MRIRELDRGARGALGLALATGIGLVVAYAMLPDGEQARAVMADGAVLVACLVAGGVLLASRRSPHAWRTAGLLGIGMLSLAAAAAGFLARDLIDPGPLPPGPIDLAFVPLGVLFFAPARREFLTHFRRRDRREIVADTILIAAACSIVAYLLLHSSDSDASTAVSAGVFSVIAVSAVAVYGALALWVPTAEHLGQLAAFIAMAGGVAAFAVHRVDGQYIGGYPEVGLSVAGGALLLAGVATALPRRADEGPLAEPGRLSRAVLTVLAIGAACGSLAFVASMAVNDRVGAGQATAFVATLAAAIALRVLANQVQSVSAHRNADGALAQKEAALRETDLALARLRRANETLRISEERLRLLFEAAVDGIVELDGSDVILGVNDAFCRMIGMPEGLVTGRAWTALAVAVDGSDESFAQLPGTGQCTLQREGHALHLEARVSEIPGDPPRRLLLVRDVTAQRVADQTIRSLFKFLQDRDEDRTRLLRRTNAAIEAERNRIARDLHDGPVQGVSAASLSLEAALLMLKAGDAGESVNVLGKVREELSEEADNLRRLMSGLRPPLLEERGMIPAIRETLERFGKEQEVETSFQARVTVDVPQDIETLAYRVVQEALSNASKHAEAGEISVTVEAEAGQLRIEIVDDGVGFDPARAREFLRIGRVGLASMRERVELANGTFMVHSTPGKGTTVMATLPLETVIQPTDIASARPRDTRASDAG